MNQPVAFALLFGGGILLVKAVTGSSWSSIVQGKPGSVGTTGDNLLSNGVAGAGQTIAGAVPGQVNTGGTIVGDVTYGDLQAIGKLHGWSTAQIQAWAQIIPLESNGTITDTNSSSGAYGIAQFINGPSEYATYGGNSTSVMGQLTSMANYIAQRYGSPTQALSFHLANNWY